MIYTVAIIGSFRKSYTEILDIIKIFKQNGLEVLSPKESYISGKIEEFVIFESDRKDFSPAEIQMITLNKIIAADIVYVYDPNGYVGRTTCYEIGFCFSKKKPIFFFDYPNDIPIPVIKEKQVIKPQELVQFVFHNDTRFITNYNLCLEGQKAFCNLFDLDKEVKNVKSKKIVVCGSMAFFEDMVKCQEQLKLLGIDAIIPKEENDIIQFCNENQLIEFKKKVSRTYLKKIRNKDTAGVLVYNKEKNGIVNYIGANTLVELAMAFTWNRKIFLYNDIYSPLKDELQAWDCICLNGNLDRLKEEFVKLTPPIEESIFSQLTFFD